MFIQNRDSLIALARNTKEKEIITLLVDLVEVSLELAQPARLLSSSISFDEENMELDNKKIDFSSYEKIFLIAIGKASQTMAEWFFKHSSLSFSRIIIVSPYEKTNFLSSKTNFTYYKTGHPVPDAASVEAAEHVLSLIQTLSSKDLCLFLISGGGSSLFEIPDFNLALPEYVSLIDKLHQSGATIDELNTIRKHFSKVKGGKLAIQTNANLVSIIISDVIGDNPSNIASGPTVPDNSTWENCLQIFKKYEIYYDLPNKIASIIEKGLKKEILDTPSDKKLFTHVQNFIVGNNSEILRSINEVLSKNHCVEILDYQIKGEARETGKMLANIASQKFEERIKSKSSFYFIVFGGETTVKLSLHPCVGGRNQELALGFALQNQCKYPIYLASFGTDGIDGNSKAAGAIVGPFTIMNQEESKTASIELNKHNSNKFFKMNGGEIITGYTGTNVMDIGIICIEVDNQSHFPIH
ncbi:MAG: glycerate kinase [Candidatus Thorarchaeota archaeon]